MTPPFAIVGDSAQAAFVATTRASRCRVALRHYRRRPAPFAPSPAAVAGALDIYAEGRQNEDVLRMLFGLSILRSATAEQVDAAIAARSAAGQTDEFAASISFTAEPALAATTSS